LTNVQFLHDIALKVESGLNNYTSLSPLILDISNIVFKLISIVVNKLLTALGNGNDKVDLYPKD